MLTEELFNDAYRSSGEQLTLEVLDAPSTIQTLTRIDVAWLRQAQALIAGANFIEFVCVN